nr:cytochrome P450 4d2-like [Onthophagus taurus]
MNYYLILAIVILIIVLISLRLLKYQAINSLPGTNWLEVFKFLVLKKSNSDILNFILNLHKRYGSVVKIWIKPFRPIIIVSDPKYFEAILGSKEHLHKTKLYDILHRLAGDGLGTVRDVKQWKADRIFFNPLFKHKSISNYTFKLKRHMDDFKNVLITHINRPVDVYFIIHHCAMCMILEYLIDETVNAETTTNIIHAIDKSFEMVLERVYSAIKSNELLFRFTRMYRTWEKVHQFVDNIFLDLIHERMKLRGNTPTETITERKNLMDLLLENDFSEEYIMGHLKSFFIAGYDTVATTTSFALFEIAKRKDVQEKILQEYLSLAGNNEDYILTFDDLHNMTYTESVIKETLRMYPVIPAIERKVKSPITIDGFCIPADTDITFSIASLHYSNFANPEVFDPNRFSPENINKVKPYSYAPFSIGPRNCIGQKLAIVEMKFILSHTVKDFTLHSVQPEHKLQLATDFLLKSKNGMPIIFKKRSNNEMRK